MEKKAITILEFLALSERLKRELRHSWLSDGRRESVAEHTWQMSLIALLGYRHLEQPVEIERVLKMIIVHDLVEAIAGDVPYFENGLRKKLKTEREQAAIDEIRVRLAGETGQEFFDLWHEFEARVTIEAKYASALDHLEVQIQHNLADIDTWEPIEYDLVYTKMLDRCSHDSFLTARVARSENRQKIRCWQRALTFHRLRRGLACSSWTICNCPLRDILRRRASLVANGVKRTCVHFDPSVHQRSEVLARAS